MKPIYLFFLLLPTIALAAKTEAEIRESVQELIAQRHPVIPQGFWEGLGPDAPVVLRKMYTEIKNPVHQSFLIEGLSHFHDTPTAVFLESQVRASKSEVSRKKLLNAVLHSEGEAAFDFVEPYLKDDSPHVRLAVAKGLKAYAQNEKIKTRLDVFKKTEKKAWVAEELERANDVSEVQKIRTLSAPHEPQKNADSTLKSDTPLSEKQWAGVWKGTLVQPLKTEIVDLTLTAVDVNSKPIKWKAEIWLPKKLKQEWRSGDFVVQYFQTARLHWVELRHPKLDSVLVAQRKFENNGVGAK